MREKIAWVYIWTLFGLELLWRASGAYTVSVLASPSTCYGGSPCIVQPSLAVYLDGEINLGFSGYVYAQMEESPSGLEPLYVPLAFGLCFTYLTLATLHSNPSMSMTSPRLPQSTMAISLTSMSSLSSLTSLSDYKIKSFILPFFKPLPPPFYFGHPNGLGLAA